MFIVWSSYDFFMDRSSRRFSFPESVATGIECHGTKFCLYRRIPCSQLCMSDVPSRLSTAKLGVISKWIRK